jgi:predicted Rossmann fold nucleotide-binding protein DprA/Smf involved in DNA uptake
MREENKNENSSFKGEKEILENCKLTEEEMKKYLELSEDVNHKLDHTRAYRTMMNQTRRELLNFVGSNIKNFDEIKEKFQSDENQLHYHLSMLEQLLYLMNTESGWKATPRGLAFLYNTILDE